MVGSEIDVIISVSKKTAVHSGSLFLIFLFNTAINDFLDESAEFTDKSDRLLVFFI